MILLGFVLAGCAVTQTIPSGNFGYSQTPYGNYVAIPCGTLCANSNAVNCIEDCDEDDYYGNRFSNDLVNSYNGWIYPL